MAAAASTQARSTQINVSVSMEVPSAHTVSDSKELKMNNHPADIFHSASKSEQELVEMLC